MPDNTYKCLIVDDESLAQDLVEAHLKKIPGFDCVGKCSTAMEAMQALSERAVDVLFLDIEMPDITGLEFLRSLNNQPLTVLTTAYSEYALDGYELGVVDYLLKPITFERFFKTASKLSGLLDTKPSQMAQEPKSGIEQQAIFVKSEYKLLQIRLNEIEFVEGMQKYVVIHRKDKEKVVTLMSMTKAEEILPASKFMRIHKSYIVNLEKIREISGNRIKLEKGEIPLSKNLKSALIDRIDQHGLLK